MHLTNFNNIAPYYDFLADVVFGGAILRAQTNFLGSIKPGARVIVVGGGTGRILKPLTGGNPETEIWYVDNSSAMIETARSAITNPDRVHFILGTIEDLPPDATFDTVILPFFLDMFTESEVSSIINRLIRRSAPGCKWLVTDFVRVRWWHSVMLWVMYTFFRWCCNVNARRLPPWQRCLSDKLTRGQQQSFFGGFISAETFIKESP